MSIAELLEQIRTRYANDSLVVPGHVYAYGRRKRKRRGEVDWRHVLFHPVVEEPLETIGAIRSDQLGREIEELLPLPLEFGELLTLTNGAYIGGARLVLYGLPEDLPFEQDTILPFSPISLIAANFSARLPSVPQSLTILGYYFEAREALTFNPGSQEIRVFPERKDRAWRSFADCLQAEVARLGEE